MFGKDSFTFIVKGRVQVRRVWIIKIRGNALESQ
jgi:hypothetical protein